MHRASFYQLDPSHAEVEQWQWMISISPSWTSVYLIHIARFESAENFVQTEFVVWRLTGGGKAYKNVHFPSSLIESLHPYTDHSCISALANFYSRHYQLYLVLFTPTAFFKHGDFAVCLSLSSKIKSLMIV